MKRYFLSASLISKEYYLDCGSEFAKLRYDLGNLKYSCQNKSGIPFFSDSINKQLEKLMPFKRKAVLYIEKNLESSVKKCLTNLLKDTKIKIKAVKDLREV